EVPVSLHADFVNGQNIRMIQGRSDARFAFESAQLDLVRRQLLWEKLERDFAPESLVSCEIHIAHSANTNKRLDSVMTDRFSHHRARPGVSQKFGSNLEGGRFDKTFCGLITGDQRLYFAAQGFIATTSFFEKRRPVLGRTFNSRLEEIVDPFPEFRFHRVLSRSA